MSQPSHPAAGRYYADVRTEDTPAEKADGVRFFVENERCRLGAEHPAFAEILAWAEGYCPRWQEL